MHCHTIQVYPDQKGDAMRVNARFEGVAEQQVAFLATSTGLKVSEVLRESVDFYYRHVRGGGGQLKHLSKLIGKGDSGRSDISTNVKNYVGEAIDAKYPVSRKKDRTSGAVKKAKPDA